MSKKITFEGVSINGNNNVLGVGNTVNNIYNSGEVDRELIALIKELVADRSEQEFYLEALAIASNSMAPPEERKSAGSGLKKFFTTVGGETGKVILRKAVEAALPWVAYIPLVDQMIKSFAGN